VPAIIRARDDDWDEIGADLQISLHNLQVNLFGFQSGISMLVWQMQIPRYNTIKCIFALETLGRFTSSSMVRLRFAQSVPMA
jgi:hypothetical protein